MRIRTAVRKNSGKPDGIGKSSGNRRKIQSAQSRQNTGFPIRIHAFHSNAVILRSARIWSRDPEPHESNADEERDQVMEKCELRPSKAI